jgi:hypothetical protein
LHISSPIKKSNCTAHKRFCIFTAGRRAAPDIDQAAGSIGPIRREWGKVHPKFSGRKVRLMNATMTVNAVKNGISRLDDEVKAVEELAEQIHQHDSELVLFFSSARYDLERLGDAINRTFPDVAAGCTTAGEIGPAGFSSQGIVGMSIGPGPIRVHPYCIPGVRSLDHMLLAKIRNEFEGDRHHFDHPLDDCLGMLLVDGLCLKEENLVAALHGLFQPMKIIGGSAGDDLAFKSTHVFGNGAFFTDGAVFLVCEMGGVPFHPFRLQDFRPITDYMVITEADPEQRIVKEIDCEPAMDVYSEVLGMKVDEITLDQYASHSLMVTIGGQDYIRSVRCCEPNGTVRLHSAIDEGVVVRICRSDDTLVSLNEMLFPGNPTVKNSDFIICFDCIHRKIELERQGTIERAGDLVKQIPTIGFTTYGEICDSIHVNQTMTGVIVGDQEERAERGS